MNDADYGQMHFADTEDEALLGSAADTVAERSRQATVVKAAQLSANFALGLIGKSPPVSLGSQAASVMLYQSTMLE